MKVFLKDPAAKKDYAVDWALWLAGDTIAVSTWRAPGLTVETSENTPSRALAWLSGGVAGAEYTVTNQVTTAAGRVEERSFVVRVEEQ